MSQPDLGFPRPEGMSVPVPVTISRAAFKVITPWFLNEDNHERRAYTNGSGSDGFLTDQQYGQRLSARLAKKLFNVAARGNLSSEVVSFDLPYGELDLVILRSILSHPDFPDADRSRRLMLEASLPLSTVYYLKDLKRPILELLESFVANGGQDVFGYLDGVRKIMPLEVEYSPAQTSDDEGIFYLADDKRGAVK